MFVTDVETHKARKVYLCDWCGQRIEPGNEYRRYRFYDGPDAATVKMHPECYEVMIELSEQEGGFIEWESRGEKRPER